MTFGTFDHFHPGHAFYLQEALKHGNELVVVIARDENVKKIKGFYPDQNEQMRLTEVQKQKFVNSVILGDLSSPYNVIQKIKPDVICLGYDQKGYSEQLSNFLKTEGLKTKVIRIESHKPEKYKSSLIRLKNQLN